MTPHPARGYQITKYASLTKQYTMVSACAIFVFFFLVAVGKWQNSSCCLLLEWSISMYTVLCLTKDHHWSYNNRNAHLVHIVNSIRFKNGVSIVAENCFVFLLFIVIVKTLHIIGNLHSISLYSLLRKAGLLFFLPCSDNISKMQINYLQLQVIDWMTFP